MHSFLPRRSARAFPCGLFGVSRRQGFPGGDDFNALRRRGDINPAGFLDLQDYARTFLISDLSLQKVYAIVFGARISKSQRLTNWEADRLTEAQQIYAAIDAWACLKLYRYLRGGYFHPYESPYAHYAEDTDEPGQMQAQA